MFWVEEPPTLSPVYSLSIYISIIQKWMYIYNLYMYTCTHIRMSDQHIPMPISNTYYSNIPICSNVFSCYIIWVAIKNCQNTNIDRSLPPYFQSLPRGVSSSKFQIQSLPNDVFLEHWMNNCRAKQWGQLSAQNGNIFECFWPKHRWDVGFKDS